MVQKMYKRCVSWPLFGEMQYRYIFVWVVCITHLNAKFIINQNFYFLNIAVL